MEGRRREGPPLFLIRKRSQTRRRPVGAVQQTAVTAVTPPRSNKPRRLLLKRADQDAVRNSRRSDPPFNPSLNRTRLTDSQINALWRVTRISDV